MIRLNYRLIYCFALFFFMFACKHHQKEIKSKKKKDLTLKKSDNNGDKTKKLSNSELIQEKLNVSEREVRNNPLYSFINEWYGVPYKYGGCLKNGVDCSCFTDLLFEKVYNKKIARVANDIYIQSVKSEIKEAKSGDLVFFKINSKTVSHIGVYIKDDFFVHASSSGGVMISNLGEAYYKEYFFCIGKIE